MNSKKLNQICLLINLGCLVVGVLAYSMVAEPKAVISTILYTLAALGGSYFCLSILAKSARGSVMTELDNQALSQDSPLVRSLYFLPIILISFEVLALFVLNVTPQSVSWIHIAAACAAGQNAEGALRKQ
ncbi:hypothetical protein [Massilia sp. ST3]|uniref:hypothetical protein n=1 Tax=Massilia sp. ST3 TaxID=2824903 RepID=UPI001B83D5FE|nr:hypothetical protein [Massilia sp. ST3]MBQ5946519.1 hypothetical protein [Massilia sp. ST3]